jgi:peptidyl-prolyl cis-trans isomerase SurA
MDGNKMKTFSLALLIITELLILKTGFCETIDRVVAVVNDKAITMLELKKQAMEQPLSPGVKTKAPEDPSANKELLSKTLDNMINELLIDEEIRKRGIEVTETELEMFIRNIMNQNGLKTRDQLNSALAIQGMNFDDYKKSLKKQIQRTKVMNYAVRSKINMSEQDVKNYYMQNTEEAREPDALHLKNIFISKKSKNVPKVQENKAREVIKKLGAGEKFEQLVGIYSEDSNAKTGGDLGFLTVKDLNPKIYSEVSKLKVGQHTGIIDTEGGYYILKLEEKRSGQIRPFDEIKEELKTHLTAKETEKEFSSWLSDLKSRSFIEIKL